MTRINMDLFRNELKTLLNTVYDKEFKKKYYLNGHMNPMGYILTANLIDSYIDYIIRTNPADFKFAGLIGSGIEY